MLRHVLESGSGRDIHFYWGARHAADLYEESAGARVAAPLPAAELHRSALGGERRRGRAPPRRLGARGGARRPSAAGGFEVYAAGPPAMIEAMRASFPRHGLPPERLYFDSFDYAPDVAR